MIRVVLCKLLKDGKNHHPTVTEDFLTIKMNECLTILLPAEKTSDLMFVSQN